MNARFPDMHLDTELAMSDLLIAEEDPALLDVICPETGIPLWCFVRLLFVRMIISDLVYSNTPMLHSKAKRGSGLSAARTLGKSILHNASRSRRSRADICIMATAVGTNLQEGRWFNRLSDHFALVFPNETLVIEDQFEWTWRFPRRFENVAFHAPLQAAGVTAGRALVRERHFAAARQVVGMASRRAQEHLGWTIGNERTDLLVKLLARKAASLPVLYGAYVRMLKRVRPRLLLKEEACYGLAAPLIAAAKSLGITTAEYQHGFVSSGHEAYNVSNALRESAAFQRILPEYFLGYGSWWNSQINVPVHKITVGNPHRSEKMASMPPLPPMKTDLLILGDGIETPLYLDIAKQLVPVARKLGLQVVFRPHPLERARIAGMNGIAELGFAIDTQPDIYRSFAGAHTVVSELSTGLFEAVGIADRIFVWSTPKSRFFCPHHPFQSFQNADELAQLVAAENSLPPLSQSDRDAIWAPDWRANYQAFVDRCVESIPSCRGPQ